jgi:hypothetical protein
MIHKQSSMRDRISSVGFRGIVRLSPCHFFQIDHWL